MHLCGYHVVHCEVKSAASAYLNVTFFNGSRGRTSQSDMILLCHSPSDSLAALTTCHISSCNSGVWFTHLLLPLLCSPAYFSSPLRVLFLALHDPPTTMLRIFLDLLRILEQLQNLAGLRHIIPLLDGRITHHAISPRLDQRKLFNIHARPPSPQHPPDVRDIRNRDLVVHQIL